MQYTLRIRRLLLAYILLLPSVFAQTPTRSADAYVADGVQAFKSGRYEAAAQFFRKALAIAPTEQTHLYLGVTYAYQVVPHVDTPENLKLADEAVAQFDIVLRANPNAVIAIRQEASVYRITGREQKARELERSAEPLDPANPEIPYTIGVLDWVEAYRNTQLGLSSEGLMDNGVGNSKKSPELCAKLKTQNTPLLDDALANLTRAVELDTSYEEAMTYLSLVYRGRANLHCSDPKAVTQDIVLADTWARKSMAARKSNQTSRQPTAADPLLQPPITPPPPPLPPPPPVPVEPGPPPTR